MIGFRHINKTDRDDGFDLLPEHVKTGVESTTPSAFFRSPIQENNSTVEPMKAPFFMHLSHDGLRHFASTKSAANVADRGVPMEVAPRTTLFWCQYPPPRLIGGGRLLYGQKDAVNLFASLP